MRDFLRTRSAHHVLSINWPTSKLTLFYRLFAHIVSAGANDPVKLVLFDGMTDPADCPA
jgi:hypothetical protein